MLEAKGQPKGPGLEEPGPSSVWTSLTSSETLQICSSRFPHILDCGYVNVTGPGPGAPPFCCRVQQLFSAFEQIHGNSLFPAFPSELLMLLACSEVWESGDQDCLEDNFVLHRPLAGPSAPNLLGTESQVCGQGRKGILYPLKSFWVKGSY